MSLEQPVVIHYADWAKFLLNPPLITTFQADWCSIELAYYYQLIELLELAGSHHTVVIPLGYQTPEHQGFDLEVVSEARLKERFLFQEKDCTDGCIQIYPANLACGLRSDSDPKALEHIHCYLEPTVVAQIAHEPMNPDRVELLLVLKKADLLIQQMGLALKENLETDGVSYRFYIDVMATALSAHLLLYYSTGSHQLREHEDGLPQQKFKQAIEYMQTHLGENLSLNDIANELGMSQYYFCHLFKRSTGISPHQYIIRQRVERAKQLLSQPKQTIASIAMECGFANQSHFAKYFRQCTGMNPNQFRKAVL